jgi:hypothetical protein
VANMAGTWYWVASYTSDQADDAISTGRTDEPVVVTQVQPAITTAANPTSADSGATIKDVATLSSAFEPTGTITFTLYDPTNTAVYTASAQVHGNGQYSSGGYTAVPAGTWHWKADYSGDGNNLTVSSNAADEPVTIAAAGATGGVLAFTGATPSAEILALMLIGFGGLTLLAAMALRRRAS